MKTRVFFAAACIAGAAGFFFSGCGGETKETDTRQVFRFNELGDVSSLDPVMAGSFENNWALNQLYNGLVEMDTAMYVQPCIARSWEISDDGLTYTFTIRDDLEFSDGSELVADDIRRSWLRLLDPATSATAPDVLSVVGGATERLAGDADEDDVGIRAPDDTTLVVTLEHPASYFLDIVATPATFVVPRTADATPTWQQADAFVGSGPYVVESTDGVDTVLRPEALARPADVPVGEHVEEALHRVARAGDVELVQVHPHGLDQVAGLGQHVAVHDIGRVGAPMPFCMVVVRFRLSRR